MPLPFFSNITKNLDAEFAAVDDTTKAEFLKSEAYQAICKVKTTTKTQSVHVTQNLINKTAAQKRKNDGRRIVSQHYVMAAPGVSEKEASATNYAQSLYTSVTVKNIRWEWLHLVMHAVLGDAAQNQDNLVAGTYHANTNMILAENNIPFLANKYPEGFSLIIDSTLEPDTHIAKEINYSIKTPDVTLPLNFNAKETRQPHSAFNTYMKEFVANLVECVQAHKPDSTQNTNSSTSPRKA